MIMLFMKYDQTLRTDISWSLILDSTGPGISKAAFQAFFPGIAREENFLGSWRVGRPTSLMPPARLSAIFPVLCHGTRHVGGVI